MTIRDFVRSVDVVFNELIPLDSFSDCTFGGCYQAYMRMLDDYRFLTFGRMRV